ncbi:SDR family oxidoreductase [Georgenia satyanarayanai]|uniref:SDR family oxidoreductase n=1 Tax=Georgenia satyanarayanai TaxID=860221 RepID=UPI00203D066A|nr:SDR family oxidoreductase [Georgenia satyanarayanai]MCM3659400.1 SDR family oxidoreductase [Georgenia satyanarayanai]
MEIAGSTALVTGANRGIGAEFVRQLKERGARKIYAAARRPESVTIDGVEVLTLDVTDAAQIRVAARIADDVDLLINNAGVSSGQPLLTGDLAAIRHDMEVNLFGPLAMARAFAPVLAANGGGTLLNVLSAAGWFVVPGATAYGMTKAAAWNLTDGLRLELAGQGTHVVGLQMATVDTDMTKHLAVEKSPTDVVVSRALDGIESGASEVVADRLTAEVKAGLGLDAAERYGALLPA